MVTGYELEEGYLDTTSGEPDLRKNIIIWIIQQGKNEGKKKGSPLKRRFW